MKNTVVFFITSISFLLFQQLAFGFESAENKSKTHFQLDRRMEISDQHANLTVLSMEKNMIEKKLYTVFSPKISNLDARKKWIIGSLNSDGKIFIDKRLSLS